MTGIKTILRLVCILGFLQLIISGVSALGPIPIGFGETVSGTITPGQTDSYTFDAVAGDAMYARMASSWSAVPHIQLFAPNGTPLATSTNNIYENSLFSPLSATGTYTVIVSDGSIGEDTGTYGLFIQRTNNAGTADPILFGETKNSNLSKRGEMKSYVFGAVAGDAMYARMASSWSAVPYIQLFAPNGTPLATSTNNIYENSLFSPLSATGNYTVVVGDGTIGENNGTFGLFVQRTNNAGTADPILFGETKNSNLSKRGEMKSYVFDAYAGDRIYTRMASSWSAVPYIQLFAPNGTRIATSSNNIYENSVTSTLYETGTYAIIVSDGTIGEDTGTYSLSLQFLGTFRTIAGFSANVTSGIPPLAVQFTDSSTNSPSAWSWDFGDGNTSTLQNPSNTYGSPGRFTVRLTATNSYGSNTSAKANYIEVTKVKKSLIGVFRPSTRQFIFNTAPITRTTFGLSTDIPITGDWNGDTITDVGVFRPIARQFIFNTAPITRTTFGLSTDIPITGDWNGDTITDVGVFRPSARQFIFNTAPITRTTFGLSTDIPITGDWNGDTITDVGVFRPSTRQLIFNTSPITRTTFGLITDVPITGEWV